MGMKIDFSDEAEYERLCDARREALDAFWRVMREHYPGTILTFPAIHIEDFERAASFMVDSWLASNGLADPVD